MLRRRSAVSSAASGPQDTESRQLCRAVGRPVSRLTSTSHRNNSEANLSVAAWPPPSVLYYPKKDIRLRRGDLVVTCEGTPLAKLEVVDRSVFRLNWDRDVAGNLALDVEAIRLALVAEVLDPADRTSWG